jgi:Fic family protein
MLRIEHEGGALVMVPGQFRNRPEHDNAVGRHQPPSSARVAEFVEYFERRYRFASLGAAGRIAAMAAAHHRLNYIHPFPDGNGRVSRLMSHAMGLEQSIDKIHGCRRRCNRLEQTGVAHDAYELNRAEKR